MPHYPHEFDDSSRLRFLIRPDKRQNIEDQANQKNSGDRVYFDFGSGYGYGTVPVARWAIDTEGGHVVVSVSLIRNGYEYGRRSRGRFRIPPSIVAICRCL